MSISNESTGTRRFAANAPFFGSGWARAWKEHPARSYLLFVVGILAFTAIFGGLYMVTMSHSGVSRSSAPILDRVVRYGFVALLVGGFGAWYKWRQRSG